MVHLKSEGSDVNKQLFHLSRASALLSEARLELEPLVESKPPLCEMCRSYVDVAREALRVASGALVAAAGGAAFPPEGST